MRNWIKIMYFEQYYKNLLCFEYTFVFYFIIQIIEILKYHCIVISFYYINYHI